MTFGDPFEDSGVVQDLFGDLALAHEIVDRVISATPRETRSLTPPRPLDRGTSLIRNSPPPLGPP